MHLGLVYEPPGVHDDLVFDGVSATLVLSEIDLLVKKTFSLVVLYDPA